MTRTLIGAGVIAALAAGAITVAVTYEPPGPAGCAVLLRQADHTSDAGTLLEEAGCQQAPAGLDPTARP